MYTYSVRILPEADEEIEDTDNAHRQRHARAVRTDTRRVDSQEGGGEYRSRERESGRI